MIAARSTMSRITQRQLRRAVLARQRLLERTSESIPTVLENIAGLQSQYAPTMYIGLWSRLAGFRRGDLTAALVDRSVVQGTMVRSTIHLVSAADYWPINIAVADARRTGYLRQRNSLSEEAMRAAAEKVRGVLEDTGTLTRQRLDEVVGREARSAVGLWIDLVRVPPSGTWDRRRADIFASAETWLGPRPDMTPDDAHAHLVRHYLTGFGPASAKEIANFAGTAVGDIRLAAERVGTRRFQAEDGNELFDIAGLPLPDGDMPAPVRFIGNWEAPLLAHARRSLVIREEDRHRIFTTKMPQSLATFLVDGQVAGTWKHDDGRVVIDAWRPIPKRFRAELAEEADRLCAFHEA